MEWIRTAERLPHEGETVLTKIHDDKYLRNEQMLTYTKGLWFFQDMSMYVYYNPTHWASL